MNTLEELIYYCNEEDPVGALMLTGEWGCGKTYLIEHQLAEKLRETHILVRISLFGVDSIDSLNQKVKKRWLEECPGILGKMNKSERVAKVARGVTDLGGSIAVGLLPALKSLKDSILAINPLDFVVIMPTVKDGERTKKVVLIFDDLERSKLDNVDALGCINNYCENLCFSTIIVANEERIDKEVSQQERKGISYSEIKEKIVARTVLHKPDYGEILDSLLENRNWFNEEYRAFLEESKEQIVDVFATEIKNPEDCNEGFAKPHNIRSLKCALQDFHRVYRGLCEKEIANRAGYLYSFIAYTMFEKSGMIPQHDGNGFLLEQEIKKLYPLFSSESLLSSSLKWISSGDWDEKVFSQELEEIKKHQEDKEPKEILKNTRIEALDDVVIKSGFSELLEDCYEGKLDFDEYIIFIENACMIRRYGIEIPKEIDWSKIRNGIETSFNRCVQDEKREIIFRYTISSDSRKYFTDEEIATFDLIDSIRKNDKILLERNKKLYVNSLSNSGVDAFAVCGQKKYKQFDADMANATAEAFKNSEQSDKACFPGSFKKMWSLHFQSLDFDLNNTKCGLEILTGELEKIKDHYIGEEKRIAAGHTGRFIDCTNDMICQIDMMIESRSETVQTVFV